MPSSAFQPALLHAFVCSALVSVTWAAIPSSSDLIQCPATTVGSLDCLGLRVNSSWTSSLTADPEQKRHAPNKRAREVASGHYVLVRPTPLPDPYLVSYSREVADLLGLHEEECRKLHFTKLFSGDVAQVSAFESSWATPYALSIYGQEQLPNGAGPHGNGYGDGRAISIGEVVTETGRWELQLKGSGTTPFCRGADGRAVLRSSIREFLVSEAMHHLGVPTTRALSLTASASEHVSRPWYTKHDSSSATTLNEGDGPDDAPTMKHGGDVMKEEQCAMTARVSPSFIRVGHFELFGRRARSGDVVGRKQLEQLSRHALSREYTNHVDNRQSFQEQLLSMLTEAAERFASLAAHWIRVGYVQSNFNADNCLISGRTMDYGPFGFVERYDPGWGMWIHAGAHFAFMNQPNAAAENFRMFAESLLPLMNSQGAAQVRGILREYGLIARKAMNLMWSQKLGMPDESEEATVLWNDLEALMKAHPTDYTMMWRQLAELMGANVSSEALLKDDTAWHDIMEPAFYEPLNSDVRLQWAQWLHQWFF